MANQPAIKIGLQVITAVLGAAVGINIFNRPFRHHPLLPRPLEDTIVVDRQREQVEIPVLSDYNFMTPLDPFGATGQDLASNASMADSSPCPLPVLYRSTDGRTNGSSATERTPLLNSSREHVSPSLDRSAAIEQEPAPNETVPDSPQEPQLSPPRISGVTSSANSEVAQALPSPASKTRMPRPPDRAMTAPPRLSRQLRHLWIQRRLQASLNEDFAPAPPPYSDADSSPRYTSLPPIYESSVGSDTDENIEGSTVIDVTDDPGDITDTATSLRSEEANTSLTSQQRFETSGSGSESSISARERLCDIINWVVCIGILVLVFVFLAFVWYTLL